MKSFIHARLGPDDRTTLDRLKRDTGLTESEIVRRGLRLVAQEEFGRQSALALVGRSAGRFSGGSRDLSTNPKHLEDFGA